MLFKCLVVNSIISYYPVEVEKLGPLIFCYKVRVPPFLSNLAVLADGKFAIKIFLGKFIREIL